MHAFFSDNDSILKIYKQPGVRSISECIISGEVKIKVSTNSMFNFTNAAHGINSPLAKLIYVEVFVLIGEIGLLSLLIVGLYRRCSSSLFVKIPILVADALSYILVSYTVGLMQSSTFGNDLFVVWATCLVLVLGSADSISAFSLQDSRKWKSLSVQLAVQMFWVFWLYGTYIHEDSSFRIPAGLLIVVCLYKTSFRILTLRWVSGSEELSLRSRTKVVADYMHLEEEFRNVGPIDPVRMTGYNYLVSGENEQEPKPAGPKYCICLDPNSDKIITLDTIWWCGRLVNSKLGDELKDICLSYALAKLLCRRFFDFEIAEKGLPKTKDLVFRGLLSQDDDDPERAFRVIEVELSFIYDFFYTKYPLIFHSNHWRKVLSLGSLGPLLWLSILLFRSYNNPNDRLTLIRGHSMNYDALVTFVVVIIIFLFECLQIYFYLASDWVKVSLVCNYVSRPRCRDTLFLEKMIRLVSWLKNLTNYWQRKLSQYSLLDSFHYSPKRNIISELVHDLIDKRRRGQKEGDSINLSETVKKAIIRSLKICNGRLSNGKASLERNGAAQLSEAFNLGNPAQSILVWHIATTLCVQHTLIEEEKHKGKDDNNGGLGARCFSRRNISRHINESIGDDYEIAISLSNYCAYLVAFAPKFLPDNSYDTEVMFDAVVEEANELLSDSKSMHQIHEKMMNMTEAADTSTIVVNGALLGKKLIEEMKTEEKRWWKVLADYWAEVILFIAPSNNATVHFEKVAQGGELITHLWALLNHAGIVEREALLSTA